MRESERERVSERVWRPLNDQNLFKSLSHRHHGLEKIMKEVKISIRDKQIVHRRSKVSQIVIIGPLFSFFQSNSAKKESRQKFIEKKSSS